MRTLSIGNSFSQDACAYLHQIAESAGVALECVNLYIGGCSLETHAANLASGEKNYSLEINGVPTGKYVSINEMLEEGGFDVVTLQQASHFSGLRETYYPYIEALAEAVRDAMPDCRLMIHETWAYEIDSGHGSFVNYGKDQRVMYEKLHSAYYEAAKLLDCDIIPVGDTIQHLRETCAEFDRSAGGVPLTRDGFHLSIPQGRMTAGYVWLETLCGVSCENAGFIPDGLDENNVRLVMAARSAAHKYVNMLNK